MKIPGKEEIGEFSQAVTKGFLEGAAVGVPIALGLRFILDKRTAFKNAGGFPRTLLMISPPIFCGATWMEIRSREFERERRERKAAEGVFGSVTGARAGSDASNYGSTSSQLSTGISGWIAENKYKCIITGWAAVLGGSFWHINKDPYMTRSQKIVQARVWAQGATVLMLVASVVLSVGSAEKAKEEKKALARDSWKRHLSEKSQ